MSLKLTNPQQKVDQIVDFLQTIYQQQHKQTGVIAVSGGVDSVLSLTLLTKALGAENIIPIFLPYHSQSIEDGQLAAKFNQIPQKNWQTINIGQIVDQIATTRHIELENNNLTTNLKIRLGNIMARIRMTILYDIAKQHNAMVCGTENKSEKYLGYFTMHGDGASDIEPILSLFKTQVYQLAEFLNLPERFITKSPSAGLWQDQTDESELGFTYAQADQILLAKEENRLDEISQTEDPQLISKVMAQVEKMNFKHQVPYVLQ